MRLSVRLASRMYRAVLELFPESFRETFAAEMLSVFDCLAGEAAALGLGALLRTCWRELRDLPLTLGREHWHEFRNRSNPMKTGPEPPPPPVNAGPPLAPLPRDQASWAAVTFGTLPFLAWGLFLIVMEIPREWVSLQSLAPVAQPMLLALMLIPPLGCGLAWVQHFPRWSYPYAGMALTMALYMTGVATPGLRILGYTFGRNDLWGWRAFLPLLVAMLLALLISRSLRPLISFFTNIWHDWTILTYSLFGVLPLLVLMAFDEIDRLYSLLFMVPVAGLLVGTAAAYLRTAHKGWRTLVLLAGVSLTALLGLAGSALYWVDSDWTGLLRSVGYAAILVAVVFSPALLGLIHYGTDHSRPT